MYAKPITKKRAIIDPNDVDENGVIKDGGRVRVPLFMRDSWRHQPGSYYGDDVEDDDAELDAIAAGLDEEVTREVAQDRDFMKANLSAAFKGGLTPGDIFRLGDRMVRVIGRDGKVTCADASMVAPELVIGADGKMVVRDAAADSGTTLKDQSYLDYDRDITSAWCRSRDSSEWQPASGREGDVCTVNGRPGRVSREGNRLVCRPISQSQPRPQSREQRQKEPSDMEWGLAGPLSDATSLDDAIAKARAIKDQAYAEAEAELVNRWRR